MTKPCAACHAAIVGFCSASQHPTSTFSVFGRNLRCQPVRGSEHPRGMALITRMAAPHAEQRCETQWHPRVKTSPTTNTHRTSSCPTCSNASVARACWLLEREEHRTSSCPTCSNTSGKSGTSSLSTPCTISKVAFLEGSSGVRVIPSLHGWGGHTFSVA